MLVLSRRRGEALVIGDQLRVTVLNVGRSSVRLGIEAPSGVVIVREELLLDAEERAAQRVWHEEDRPTAAQNA